MSTAARRQHRYDHRFRELVRRTGELRLATERGVPRSTARAWLCASPHQVVGLRGTDLTDSELRQEILTLQRRVEKLAALLRLALVVRPRGERWLTGERLPDGPAKARMLSAVNRARTCMPLRGILRFLHVSPSRFTPGVVGSARVHSTIRHHVPVPHRSDSRAARSRRW